MSSFDMLCEVLERLDPETYNDIMAEKTAEVLPALVGITVDGMDGISLYMDFILCSVAADGQLSEDEYLFLKPLLDQAMEADTTFGDAQKFFYDNNLNNPEGYKATMDAVVDLLGLLDPKLKEDIIMICLMVCAVDGEISEKEREWVKQLIA